MTEAALPTAEQVSAARRAAGKTQAEAAEMVHLGHGSRWWEYEQGRRAIDLARWELFLIKTGQHQAYRARRVSPKRSG